MIQALTTITKVISPLLVLVSLTSFVHAQAPFITCPGTTVTYGDQSNNDKDLWNDIPYWDQIIGSHDLAENAVPLEINITDTCTTGTLKVKYILYLDLDYYGTQETRVDSDTLPAANTIHYNNNNLAVTAGTQRQFDFRPVPAVDKFRFDLLLNSVSPTQTKAQLVWRNSPTTTALAQLPYGTHKIKWVVTNGCGQQSTCEYTFIIRDEKPPTVVCVNGLSVNIMNIGGGLIQLWASDFLQYSDDNYTPSPQIKIGIRKQGTGTGFPYDTLGNAQTGIQFKCDELGTNLVELWAIDKANNASFCETYALVTDNNNNCLPNTFIFAGNVMTEFGEGISDVQISDPFIFTDGSGNFYLIDSLPPSTNITITPTLEYDPLNGVNTWDLVLMSRHILAVEPLNSPYKIISADINKSGTVTAFDILETRRLILGTYTKFPSNSSWRFVDKSQVFTNPLNPFANVIKENTNAIPAYFIGMKIGDMDNSATPNNFSTPLEDRTEKTNFTFKDQNIEENEVVSLHFAAERIIEGYQMTLDLAQFEVLEIIPQNDLTMDNFAIFDQAITMVTEQPNQGFDLRLRAKQAGRLSSMLAVNDNITRSVAFEANGASKGIALRFDPMNSNTPQLYPISPNPWNERTNISFYLPEPGPTVLTVVDGLGRTIYTNNTVYSKGHQTVSLDHTQIPVAGLYWLVLETGSGKLTQKMIKYEH
jgi:hypothetical protein